MITVILLISIIAFIMSTISLVLILSINKQVKEIKDAISNTIDGDTLYYRKSYIDTLCKK